MALSTDMIKIILDMVRIGDILIVRGMAGIAICRSVLISVGMTGDTLQRAMSTSQRKLRIIMVECRW